MKPAEISELVRIASNLSVLFPLVAYLTKARYATRRIHIIGLLIFVSAVCDVLGYIRFQNGQSTAVLFNLYYLALFGFLWWFYHEIVFIGTRRLITYIGLAVYLQSLILITLFVQDFYHHQSLLWLISGIIMLVFSIEYFLYLFSTGPGVNLLNYTTMWINSGVLLYFAFNLFLFILSNFLFDQEDNDVGLAIWSFHNVNNIIKNVLFGIGLSLHKRKISDF